MTTKEQDNSAIPSGASYVDPAGGSAEPTTSYVAPTPSPSQIGPANQEIREDALARQEQKAGDAAVETRAQRLASDLVERRHELQGQLFWLMIVVVCVFYLGFILTVVHLAWSDKLLHKEFPATATFLVGMLGSIPTILSAFLLVGLFAKESKDKDDKGGSADLGSLAKLLSEVLKHLKH